MPIWGQTPNASPPTATLVKAADPAGNESFSDLAAPSTTPLSPDQSPAPEGTPAEPEHILQKFRLDYTWLPQGDRHGLEISDVELSATYALPIGDGWAPFLIT